MHGCMHGECEPASFLFFTQTRSTRVLVHESGGQSVGSDRKFVGLSGKKRSGRILLRDDDTRGRQETATTRHTHKSSGPRLLHGLSEGGALARSCGCGVFHSSWNCQ